MRERESKLFHFTPVRWTHLLCFLLMAVHDCADAQAGTSSSLPYSFGLRENMGASFTVMVVAFLSAFAFMGFFTLYLRHCAHMYVATGNPISAAAELCRRGCNQQVIDNCPIVKYSTVKEIKMGKEALECAVCLAEFQDYDRLRLLPKCNHVFHPDCIDAWLSSHVTCPLCRAKLTSDCGQNLTQLLPRNMNEPQHPQNTASTGEMEQHQVAVEVLPGSDQLPVTSAAINPIENVTQVCTLNRIQTPRPSPPLGFRLLLETLPRSHSTGHSCICLEADPEQGNYMDRYSLTLPEHVKKQILMNHNRIRRLPTSDNVLPKLWSPRREMKASELGETASSLQLPPPFVSSTMTPVKLEGDGERQRPYGKLKKPMWEQPPDIPSQSLNGLHCPPL